jgi:hypothetical protein
MKFHLQVAAGNQFLVLTGLLPSFISKRNERCGAPDLAFYKSVARHAFQGPPIAPMPRAGSLDSFSATWRRCRRKRAVP